MISIEKFLKTGKHNLPAEDAGKILTAVVAASVKINEMVNKAGLLNVLGAAGSENIQGETQQKLDIIANGEMVIACKNSRIISAIASEENEHIIETGNTGKEKYIMAMDPLDGSSNIDVNVSIGTIFSVYAKKSAELVSENDFFRKGSEQLMAGYVIYGSSTMLIFTTGNGVNGFTLDRSREQYFLSHPDMKMPLDGKIYSVNEGNFESMSGNLQAYITFCRSSSNPSAAPYSARYIGSMVADVHRNLLKGGIFLYPATTKSPMGKLRLLYEGNPMAMIVEQAGGVAHTGSLPILDQQVSTLHERVPVFLGPVNMMKQLLQFLDEKELNPFHNFNSR